MNYDGEAFTWQAQIAGRSLRNLPRAAITIHGHFDCIIRACHQEAVVPIRKGNVTKISEMLSRTIVRIREKFWTRHSSRPMIWHIIWLCQLTFSTKKMFNGIEFYVSINTKIRKRYI